MLVVWVYPDTKQLCYSDSLGKVPEELRDKALVFENLSMDDAFRLVYDGNQVRVLDGAELLQKVKDDKLRELKRMACTKLQETDWCVVKCVELGLNPHQEYPEVMAERAAIRQKVNQLEETIRNASSLNELRNIKIEI